MNDYDHALIEVLTTLFDGQIELQRRVRVLDRALANRIRAERQDQMRRAWARRKDAAA